MQERLLAAIMFTLRSFSEVGLARRSLFEGRPAHRNHCEGGFTDIVGYTALMGKDEDRVIEMLCRHREILRPSIDKHKG